MTLDEEIAQLSMMTRMRGNVRRVTVWLDYIHWTGMNADAVCTSTKETRLAQWRTSIAEFDKARDNTGMII